PTRRSSDLEPAHRVARTQSVRLDLRASITYSLNPPVPPSRAVLIEICHLDSPGLRVKSTGAFPQLEPRAFPLGPHLARFVFCPRRVVFRSAGRCLMLGDFHRPARDGLGGGERFLVFLRAKRERAERHDAASVL